MKSEKASDLRGDFATMCMVIGVMVCVEDRKRMLETRKRNGWMAIECLWLKIANHKKKPRHQDTKTPRRQETKTPRNEETKKSRNKDIKTSRHQDTKKPRNLDTKKPRHQDTKTPRNQET